MQQGYTLAGKMRLVRVWLLFVCILSVHGYEIVHPFKVENGKLKRELSTRLDSNAHEDEVIFQLDRKDGPMLLELKRNVGFHAKNLFMRTFKDDGTPKVEKFSPDSCYYSGKIAYKKESYVVLNTCDGLSGTIEDEGKSYAIEPIEGSQDGAHKLYEAKPEDEDIGKRTVGVDPFKNDFVDIMHDENQNRISEAADEIQEDEDAVSNLVPEVDPVYTKYPITNKTRYCEMFLVVDKAVYEIYNRSKKVVLSKMLNAIHSVDRSYAAVNVRIVLVALEIWTDNNKIPRNDSGGRQLSLFNAYRRNNLIGLVRHDIAHYISKRGWSNGVIGMAYVGGICQTGYGTGINIWSTSITGPTVVLAHELGHNFGFPHDTSPCVCLTSRGCFMGGPKTRRPGFSDCNMKVLSDPNRAFECLNNYPKGSLDNVCGNGIIEGSEECDCGSPEMCKKTDSCCEPNGCKLKRFAQCSDFNTPDCCKNCLFKAQGTLCREAVNDCDLPEYCPGNAGTCPDDVYMRDGTACSNRISIIPGNTNRHSEKLIRLNPQIKARYLRYNPVYWKKNGYACLRTELLTCSANEDVINQPQPISTRDLYYHRSVCVAPDSSSCADSIANDTKLIFSSQLYGDCNKPNLLFVLEGDGTLRHNCSGKIVCPLSTGYLSLQKDCPNDKGKYERLPNFGLRHKVTGQCVESYNGWPSSNAAIKLRGTENCDGSRDRTKLHFLETDCLLPIGLENGKIPDSALSATSHYKNWPASKARLQGNKGWCLPSKTSGKNEYLQIDMGSIKTIGNIKTQGADWDWVTGFRLFYSDDGRDWKGYSSDNDVDKEFMSYCYSGACSKSLSTQCKDLWDSASIVANDSCWRKLNTDAAGFGTCDPVANKSCAAKDVFCGQLQCQSSSNSPYHVDYGTTYKKIDVNGAKCSAASLTIPGTKTNDEIGNIGMVTEGTKCGDGKVCSNYQCKTIAELNRRECGKVNGLVCAGQGVCDNKGVCHCKGGYDPKTNCSKALVAVDGDWGTWTEWSACTAACNAGKRKRSRKCDSPFPAHGGNLCPGVGYEDGVCNIEACPSGGSCKLVMKKLMEKKKPFIDGVYDITMPDGSIMKMYCDMTRDGGGWTLILSSHTNDWNTADMVRERNKDKPSLYKDYSILKHVDQIKNNYKISGKTFEYRIEAHERGRWGGIWSAPVLYKIDSSSAYQTDVKLVKKFDDWSYSTNGIAQRMPHYIDNWFTVQTSKDAWGTITGTNRGYHPAAWIKNKESKPEHIWYWFREGDYEGPSSCVQLKMRFLAREMKPKSGVYELTNGEGKVMSALCDMDSFGGGWTMVLNKVSKRGWSKASTLSRNTHNAGKDEDYSILFHSKEIIGLRKEQKTFQYMIEADGDKRWGGVFEGHNSDGLIACTPSKHKPKLLKKFDNWKESESSFVSTNPYVVDNPASYYTTDSRSSANQDGVLVSETDSIYIRGRKEKPSFVRVWVREGASHKSCNQIKLHGQRNGGKYKNGFYDLQKSGADIQTVYCDMTSDAGAWTLLVTSAKGGWTKQQVLSRNEDFPSISKDFSILHMADDIKNISNNATFKYKLDANKFNHWGGIWEAPIGYTFYATTYNKQQKVKLLKQFDKWSYNVWYATVNNRMPWLGGRKGILTTSGTADSYWWGTIISDNNEYNPAPWISSQMKNPGRIWYWVNEDDCNPDRMPIDGGFSPWSSWSECSSFCGEGMQIRKRLCNAPKPRCGGAPCDPSEALNETRSCNGQCLASPIRSGNDNYCVVPQTGACNPDDGTKLVWKGGKDKCDLPEAVFIFDPAHGSILHNCSGKPVCPDGNVGYGTKLMISTSCPKMSLGSRFTRTQFNTLQFGSKCLHPNGGWPGNDVQLVFWHGCEGTRIETKLFKIANGPVHVKHWSGLKSVNNSIDDLINDVRFPANPTKTGFLHNFDSPNRYSYHFGSLMWSYFLAPESGMYTFYAACNEYCQIFISTTTSESDKKKIIDMKTDSSEYRYDQLKDQKSNKIKLEEGKSYYLEGIFANKGGPGHMSLAVDFPSGIKSAPITGHYLREKAES